MHFLIGTAIVLGIIWLMVVSPSFRNVAILLLVGVGILIGILVHSSSVENEKREREQAALAVANQSQEAIERSLIAINALEFSDTSLSKEFGEYWKFNGTVKNNSKQTLTEIRFLLTISDCAKSPCLTIGEANAVTKPLMVPPGQARAFEASATFSNLPQSAAQQWKFKTIGTRGGQP
jgi:hypothetical protein